MTEPTAESVERALAGDPHAVRALIDALTPVIHVRVARAMFRRRAGSMNRDVRQEVEDLTQEVFVSLFAEDGRALRAWRSDRGLSLTNFAGLLAEHQVASIMRSGRRSPWTEDPTIAEGLEAAAGATEGPEASVASRELLGALLERLRAELTPRGLQLFETLLVQERSVEEVCAETGMQRDAVYAWRNRLGKLVRKLAGELQAERTAVSEPAAPPRKPQMGRGP